MEAALAEKGRDRIRFTSWPVAGGYGIGHNTGMLTTLDLFCGAGGLTLGFKAAGFGCLAAVEIDKPSATTFARHSPDAMLYDTDVYDVDFRRYRGRVELVMGGPPCQPFSTGGLRVAREDGRDMVPEFLRAVEEVQPYAVLMENVPGLAVGERRRYLDEILLALKSLDYQVSWQVLNADQFGVPQRRRRLFIVGVRDRRFVFPAATHGIGTGLQPVVPAGRFLSLEPRGKPNPSPVQYAARVDLRPSPYHGLMFNGGGRAINLAAPAPTIISSAGGNKTHFVDTLGIVPAYHAQLLAGGAPRKGVVEGARRITAAESALLQSFPSDLEFAGPVSAQYRQIGNAVPPLLARALAVALREQLAGRRAEAGHGTQISLFDSTSWENTEVTLPKLTRNVAVEQAVRAALASIDGYMSGKKLEGLPRPEHRRLLDKMVESQKSSVRTATLFLLFYWLMDPFWDRMRVPKGVRGTHGDKLLGHELSQRRIRFQGATTPFGENLGWKGNVKEFNLASDKRFSLFREIGQIEETEKRRLAEYLASLFAASAVPVQALPMVADDVLTFARAKALLHRLIDIPSEGHIPQLLVAALLSVHRRRHGYEVVTHHPHAADKFDRTAGDIEEKYNGQLVRAYEVTVRGDWQNRLSDFRDKMDRANLAKYVIIAAGVNSSSEWAEPAKALARIEPIGRDIAVVDILDFVHVFAAELSAVELREAIDKAYDFISNPRLCGRVDVQDSYRSVVDEWLDAVSGGAAVA